LYYFLHEQGYTFFTVPKLTFSEINLLMQEHNRRAKMEASAHKKAMNKSKRGKRK